MVVVLVARWRDQEQKQSLQYMTGLLETVCSWKTVRQQSAAQVAKL